MCAHVLEVWVKSAKTFDLSFITKLCTYKYEYKFILNNILIY